MNTPAQSASALPPVDELVIALWRRGDAASAAAFARAALLRHDRRSVRVRELLGLLEMGQPLAGEGDAQLDLPLVGRLVDRHRYGEAHVLLRALGLAQTPIGGQLDRALSEALAPFPPEADPSFNAALNLIHAGQGPSALRALDEVVQHGGRPAPWLASRHRALAALVRGEWRRAPVPQVTRDTVIARLKARDLPGALEAAETAHARELAAVLRRLVEATERILADQAPDSSDPETVPMEGHGLCELQIRMGVLSQADRGYRAILRERPEDERARAMLADVIAVREAIGETSDPVPPRRASVEWLSKKAPRKSTGWSAGGWSAGGASGTQRNPRFEDASEDSTDVLMASQEAELLLKLGRADQALSMYRLLAIRHPNQQSYRKRIAEIEAMIAQRLTTNAAEVTRRHDLRDLQAKAVPTKPNVRLPHPDRDHPSLADDEFDPPTLIDEVRDPEDG
ncbi:MAG: hypothetical protein RLP09_33530 [Sandaracinaceae bacterium]